MFLCILPRPCEIIHWLTECYITTKKTHQHYDFHPVHRLDKGIPSGIVIIAKTSVVQHAFDKKHTHFYKTYDAIVEGKLPAVPLTINWPIGRKPGSIIERCCTNEGKPARHRYNRYQSQ